MFKERENLRIISILKLFERKTPSIHDISYVGSTNSGALLLRLVSWMNLSKLLGSSKQISQSRNWENTSTYILEMLWRLNEIIQIKSLEQCLAPKNH